MNMDLWHCRQLGQREAANPSFVEPILLPIAGCIEEAKCLPLPTHKTHWHIQSSILKNKLFSLG